jgi:hypothetical protein
MKFIFPAQLFVAFTFCKSSNLLLMIVPALITNQRQRGGASNISTEKNSIVLIFFLM